MSEGISGHNVQLFEDEGSESAMNDNDALTLLSDTFPGFTEDRSIAITYVSGTKNGEYWWYPGTQSWRFWLRSADNEDPNEIQTRKLREALAQITKEFEEANQTFARQPAEERERWKIAKEAHEREINEALSKIHELQVRFKVVSHWMAPCLNWNDRNIGPNLYKETQSNVRCGWATTLSAPRCSKMSLTRLEQRSDMALNKKGGHFIHRWYFQDGEVARRLQCTRHLLISLELLLLLKSSTIEFKCFQATNSSGKKACEYPVFCFTIIAWTVPSCWSAISFFLVVYGDYMHPATLFLTRSLS